MNPSGFLAHTLSSIVDAELPDSVNRLIRLRWLAGIGVLTLTLSVGPLFNVVAPTTPLLAIGVCILVYNLAFLLIEGRLQRRSAKANAYQQIAIWQIVLDWIAATLLIHFSGGVESPAIFFFLFHVVIASIFFFTASRNARYESMSVTGGTPHFFARSARYSRCPEPEYP